MNHSLTCDICGKEGARLRTITRSYGKGYDLLVIEEIPVVSCPHCGETYLTAETLLKSTASSYIAETLPSNVMWL